MSVSVKPQTFDDLIAMSANQPKLVVMGAKDLKPFNAQLINHFAALPKEILTYENFHRLLGQSSFVSHKKEDPQNFNWHTMGLVGSLVTEPDQLNAFYSLVGQENFKNHQGDNAGDYDSLMGAFITVMSSKEGKLAVFDHMMAQPSIGIQQQTQPQEFNEVMMGVMREFKRAEIISDQRYQELRSSNGDPAKLAEVFGHHAEALTARERSIKNALLAAAQYPASIVTDDPKPGTT